MKLVALRTETGALIFFNPAHIMTVCEAYGTDTEIQLTSGLTYRIAERRDDVVNQLEAI